MPFKLKGDEALTERIELRITPGEKQKLKEDAVLADLTVSELIRRRYFGRPIVATADMVMIHELRRQGGLLKHAMGTSSAADKEIIQAIRSIQDYVAVLQSGRAGNGR